MSHGGSRRAPLSVPDSDVDEIDDDSVDADKHRIRDSDQRRFSVKRIHVAVDCPGPNRSLKRKLSAMSSQVSFFVCFFVLIMGSDAHFSKIGNRRGAEEDGGKNCLSKTYKTLHKTNKVYIR